MLHKAWYSDASWGGLDGTDVVHLDRLCRCLSNLFLKSCKYGDSTSALRFLLQS